MHKLYQHLGNVSKFNVSNRSNAPGQSQTQKEVHQEFSEIGEESNIALAKVYQDTFSDDEVRISTISKQKK